MGWHRKWSSTRRPTPEDATMVISELVHQATQLSRIKSDDVFHKFEVTGGYDPEQDGDDPRWGRVAVKCSVCGEERRVCVSPDEMKRILGCYRKGPDEPWQPYDLLVTKGGALDRFVKVMPDGKILTYNTGHYSQHDKADLRPY